MVERVEIRNIKRFKVLDCTLEKHLVVVGLNNCGKTTLLQAIAFWSEIATYWARFNPDLARDANGNYHSTGLNVLVVSSIPLKDWDHLWPDKNVTSDASIRLQINGKILGFELIYRKREVVDIRPMRDVSESALKKYLRDPVTPVYISPISGIDQEYLSYGSEVIPARLARAQAGTVLHNILLDVSDDSDKWKELVGIISDFFECELTMPSAGAEIFATHQGGRSKMGLDYHSASLGFLQVVLLYAAILWKSHSVILIDEPDAHLHVFLQEKIYRDLKDRAQRQKWQLILATHSQPLINQANPEDIRVLAEGLNKISNQKLLAESLQLDNMDILLARQMRCVLYLEGWTDQRDIMDLGENIGTSFVSLFG